MNPAGPSSAADPWTGRVVGGRWKIVSLLDDSGGMASVYLAEDTRLERKAVVKIPKAAHQNAEFAERFAREAKWHAQVENLHVVHILDRGEEAGTPFLVLQYLPGGNLKAWCARNPPFLADPQRHVESWLLPIAQALDAVAAQGIVHRDVKPTNILFDAAGRGYLSDFGIVKAGGEATMTGTGMFIGTLQFMSPEQCQRESKRSLDGRSDQYGLAVTVYQVLTGWKYPVEDDDTAVVYAAKFGFEPLTEPRVHVPLVPQAVNDAVMRALSPKRDERFTTSTEFARAVLAGFGAAGEWRGVRLPGMVAGPVAAAHGVEPPPLPAESLVDTRPQTSAAQTAGTEPGRAVTPTESTRGWKMAAVVIYGLLGSCLVAMVGYEMWSSWRQNPTPLVLTPAEPQASGVVENSLGMKLVSIPAGEFEMGSHDGADDEKPVHPVWITKPFEMGQTEVTQEQWKRVMGTTPWQDEECVKEGPNVAASMVSWDGAVEFCRQLTELERRAGTLPAGRVYRLPTEAEWEYACRAGTRTAWSFGDDWRRLDDYAWFHSNALSAGEAYAHEVGRKKPNPWNLHDVHGNVSEWCSDWYDAEYDATSPAADPEGPVAGSFRVLRGGSWSLYPVGCRSAYRSGGLPAYRYSNVGFRVVRELE